MLLMQHHQGDLKLRLLVIGIPKQQVTPLVELFTRWEIHSGVEWTIKRLKGLKVDLIRMRSNMEPLTWIRKNRSGNYAGALGSVIRWSLQSDRNFRKGIQAMMAYSFYILPSLSEAQKEKFLSAINAEPEDGLDDEFHSSFKSFVHQVVKVHKIKSKAQPLITYSGSTGKKAPRLWKQPSVPQNERILDELQIFNTSGGLYLYTKYKHLYEPLLKGTKRTEYLNSIIPVEKPNIRRVDCSPEPVRGGQIHFIQEPGGKLRSVASPFRIHQEALRPLGEYLYGLVRNTPWDCTFDQSKALPFIQTHLEKGGVAHSIDLSSATDLFPLSIQMDVLRTVVDLKHQPDVSLFEEISRSTWDSPIGLLEWRKGQPLGLFPSFATFTLTHGLLLLYLNRGKYNHEFFVLGDDVIILNDQLRDDYVSMLSRMRCPWSQEKSLSSSLLCEFGGKIYTKDWVLPQLKWRKVSDDNFLDICRLLGKRSRCLLSRRQRAVFDLVANLCDPIGLNFSLPGDNLERMQLRTLQAYHPEEVVLASLMDLRGRVNRYAYSSCENLDTEQVSEICTTFDEKVKSALSHTLFARWEVSNLIGLEGLATLPAALDLQPRLPLKERKPTRLTTLLRYERLFTCH